MDDQNNNNAGGGAPSEPAAPTPEPAPMAEPAAQPQAQKCVTCGNTASGGNCVACAQGEATCTCPPASPSGEVGGQGAPVV